MKKIHIIAFLLMLAASFTACLDEHQEPVDLSLKVGNIYCVDGNIYPVDYFATMGKSPAGIVTAVGGPNDNYRALVMGLEDAGQAYYVNTVLEDISDVSSDVTLFDGKENTAALLMAALNSDSTCVIIPAGALLCSTYNANGVGAWHLPSVAEFRTVASAYTVISASLKAVGAAPLDVRYQTSTIDGTSSNAQQLYNYTIELPKGNIASSIKTESHLVRPFMILR